MTEVKEHTAPTGEIRRAARAGVLLVAAGGITGALNLIFNVVVAREGGVSDYGAIGPLLTVVTVVGLLATGFQFGIARHAAVTTRPPAQLLWPALRSVLPWAAGALVLAVLSWPLAGFLHLHSVLPVLLIAALAALGVLGAAVSGLLVGLRHFRVIAALGVGSALLRLALGFLVGHGQGAVLLSLVASLAQGAATFAGGLAVLMFILGHGTAVTSAPAVRADPGPAGRTGLTGSLIAGALWAVWGLPVLFARHVLSPAAAGDFAATQLVVGALIWGTAPIVTAFFPTIARHRARTAVIFGELATASIALLGAAVLTGIGPGLIARVYGAGFGESRPLIAALALSATITTCATFTAWSAVAAKEHVAGIVVALALALSLEFVWDLSVARELLALALGPGLALLLGGASFMAVGRRLPTKRSDSDRSKGAGALPDLQEAAVSGER